jgi:Histidine kinase
MNATTSGQVYLTADADSSSAPARSRLMTKPLLIIITAYWVYVTLSNILYTRSLSAGIDPTGAANFFAPWTARVLQHVLLYPLLLGAMWISLRVGWKPVWRAVPIQVIVGLLFSGLATPLLAISEHLFSGSLTEYGYVEESVRIFFTRERLSLWLAGWTNFELTYGFALALVSGFSLYQRSRDSEVRLAALEKAWSDARLGALRAQLSPHTLFNLLHTIRGQIAWDPAAAQSMVVQLGDLLRKLLTAGQREFSLLRDEMQFVRLYLELQRQRFAERLTLTLPDNDSLPSVWVPSLILQPLVENAVVHGIAGHEGPVAIRLQIEPGEETLLLRVINTVSAGRRPGTDGIGVRNVRERLEVHFGQRAAFHAGLTSASEWRAEIRMPLLREKSL